MLTLLMKALRLRLCAAVLIPWLASGCATVEVEPFPDPLRPPKPLPATTTGLGEVPSPAEDARTGPRTTRAPGVVIQRTVAEGIADRLGEDLTGDPIRVSFHDVPLVPFINEVFGEELGMSFVISPGLEDRARDARGEGGESRGDGRETRRDTEQPRAAGPAGGRIVVDRNRNMLLFRGSGKEWAEIRRVIERLDRAVPSVLIEVLIAGVTLADEERTGFEFLIRGAIGSRGLTAGTIGGLGIAAGGLSFALEGTGSDRAAVLNLFYKDDRVVIRSRPRLLVKSGETASIDVGNEIPVVTRTTDSDQVVEGTTNVLREISYRKTGVQLEIKPLVQANGLVDLAISQQLSEALPSADTSLAGSPTILNRRISTSLTLRDGGSLLMGGLISGNQSGGTTGVPVLGQLPLVGHLFRTDAVQEDRTELMIMVTPYVIADHEEGWELTRRIREQLNLHTEIQR